MSQTCLLPVIPGASAKAPLRSPSPEMPVLGRFSEDLDFVFKMYVNFAFYSDTRGIISTRVCLKLRHLSVK